MLEKIMTLLPLAQADTEDDGGGLGRIVPLLVLAIIYGLSSLLKKKQEKKQSQPRPSAPASGQTRGARQLPSYARGRTQGTTTQPQQRTQQVPGQSRTTTPATRPAGQQPARGVIAPEPPIRKVQVRPTQRIPASGQPVRPRAAIPQSAQFAAAHRVRAGAVHPKKAVPSAGATKAKTTVRARSQKQMLSTAEAARLRSDAQGLRRKKAAEQVQVQSSQQKLVAALAQPSELGRAVVYAEILGKPLALRGPGTFDL